MSKLYPPQVEGTLPAVAVGQALTVPFQLNRAVSYDDIAGVAIIIKTVQTNAVLCDGVITTDKSYEATIGAFKAVFSMSEVTSQLNVGSYYKVQIAFVDAERNIGYYSPASIIKCTSTPTISIDGLDAANTNIHRYSYTGRYSQNGDNQDKSEKVYSYRFDLKDAFGKIVASSGDLIHNSANDTEPYASSDTWNVSKNLQPGDKYTIQYSVTTLNNFVAVSYAYTIMVVESVGYDFPALLSAEMNADDGFVDVSFKPDAAQSNHSVTGSFVLIRSSNEDNYDTWQELYRFDLVNKIIDAKTPLWQDFTVQQGMHYKYAIQAYNTNSLYSRKIMNIEGPVFADFEDAFLFDGERQLSIRYNPKVSSFKTTILESKMDTLGGQHPFIFRNGNVHYQEFPISGLISMLSDPNNFFTSGVQIVEQERRTKTVSMGAPYELHTHLIGENFMQERKFKLEVLDWLNDGKPKLFRSPGEGNYIVRLMNVSLSPNDTLGRMLHTFSCTAYEIAEYNFENLDKYGFVDTPIIPQHELGFENISLRTLFDGTETPTQRKTYVLPNPATTLSISNQQFDSLRLTFTYQNGFVAEDIDVRNTTGHRNIDIVNDSPITQITFVSGKIASEAMLFYTYDNFAITNNFSQITDIKVEDKIEQYIGGNFDDNLIESLEDIRLETGKFYYIKATPRNVIELYEKEGLFYKDADKVIPYGDLQPINIYYIVNKNAWYYDGKNEVTTSPDFRIQLNGDTYSDLSKQDRGTFKTQGDFKAITDIERVEVLKFGSGIILDIVYQMKTIEYEVETTNDAVKNSKIDWQEAVQEYETIVKEEEYTDTEIAKAAAAVNHYYQIYITNLTSALEGGSLL